ncbi:MAG: D-aminoacylase [Thermodesulfovibrionales bacterium]
MLDFLIKGGVVLEGSGKEPAELNVGIAGDRITHIGAESPAARTVIDARGLMVSPGFIDAHAHSEFTLLADGRAEGKLSQGVTTEVNGNCGLSAAPLHGEAFARREADCEELGIGERWSAFRDYFSLLKTRGIALNFTTLCGHGNVRASVTGYRNVPPGPEEAQEMRRLLRGAVEQGARGLSTGLIYPPGVYSSTEELVELARVPAESGGIYASHMRSEGDALLESIGEVLRIGKEAGVRVHISHIKTSGEKNWGKAEEAIGLIEQGRSAGLAVTCDRYPYVAASTDLDTVLPSWVYEGGAEEEVKRLRDPETAAKIRKELAGKDEAYWKGVSISSVVCAENKWMEGESLFAVAEREGKDPLDALFALLIAERVRTGAIFFSMSEDNLRKFLSLPYTMIGSDSSVRSFSGTTCSGKPHPRGFGSFPRFLGRYVREERLMGLPEAIRRVSSLPAQTFGLQERGMLREGFYADITVFDYEKIIDTATFKDPFRKAEGIGYVFVNGIPAVREGAFTGSRSGRVL